MLVQRVVILVQRIFVPSICFVCFILPKLTKQEKMGDCVKGKQYWSMRSFITGDGVCIACPSDWLNCYNEPIGDQQRCVDSCRAKPKTKPSSSSKFPLTPTTSFIPAELLHTEVLSSLPISGAYTLVRHPVGVKESEEERPSNNGKPDKNLGFIIAVSALSVFVLLAVGVTLLLVVRKIRNRSARTQGRADKSNEEECMALQETPRNEEGGSLQPNDEEDRLHERNDAEQRFTEPNNAEERLVEANDEEQRLYEQNNGEERLHEPCHGEERLQANDAEKRLAVQETQPLVQDTPNSICGIEADTGEDDNYCSSSFHLNQVEN